MTYEVQTQALGQGWMNCWNDPKTGKLRTYKNFKDAKAAIHIHFSQCNELFANTPDFAPKLSDYQVVRLDNPPRKLRLYRFYIPAIALGLFIWLAHYSLGHAKIDYDVGYGAELRAAHGLIAENAKASPRALIMDLYGITEADLAKPVVLWEN